MGISILLAIFLSASYLLSNNSYAQGEQKNFTAPKFGLSMQYPSDWTFVPEEEDFNTETYGYSYGSAVLGDFCPSFLVEPEPKVLDCQDKSPAYLKVHVYKLRNGTTVDQFYKQDLSKMKAASGLVPTKVIDKNKINISGLPAIESVSIKGGGSLDKLLELGGEKPTKSKSTSVYVVNGNMGYQFFTISKDQDDYDMYLPTFKDMIDSVQLK